MALDVVDVIYQLGLGRLKPPAMSFRLEWDLHTIILKSSLTLIA